MGSGGQRSVKSRSIGGGSATGSGGAALSSTASANQATGGGAVSVSSFASMSADDQWDLIQKSTQGKAANNYYAWDTDYQRFLNNSGLDGAPSLFSDDALDHESGVELYRTVYGNASFTGKQIAVKTLYDDKLLYNAGGGQVYGKGIYTAARTTWSASYSRGKNSPLMRFKVDSNSIIDTYTIDQQYKSERRKKGTLAYKLLRSDYDRDTQIAMFTLSKGYTAITHGPYTTLLTRKGVKASKKLADAYDCYYNLEGDWKKVPIYKGN